MRYEPPQLPPPPGTLVTSHFPASPVPPASWICVSIQAGQVIVAKLPCLIATFHGCVKVVTFAVRPAAPIPPARSNACLTAGLRSAMNASSALAK